MSIIFFLFFFSNAHAGKLADGFRDKPFGPASVIAEQPLEDCQSRPEKGVRWLCNTTIADAPVSVAYMQEGDLFYGVMIKSQGYTSKTVLLDTLQAAWGSGFDTPKYEGLWKDGDVIASMEYNQFSKEITVVWYDNALMQKMAAERKAKAAEAAKGDL